MWTVTFSRDTENPDIGTATATWTDPETKEVGVVVTQRVDQKHGVDALVAIAKERLATYQTQRVETNAIAEKLAGVLNS